MTERDNPQRASVQGGVFQLGREPADDLSATTTAAERLEMVVILSRRMWELTGRPIPVYSRSEMPVQLIRSA